jgi:hypothetical protein
VTRPDRILVPWPAPNDIAFSPDARVLACASDDGAVHLLDMSTGQEIRSLGDHDVDEVTALDFAPGGAVLASTDLSSSVYLWSARTGAAIGQVTHELGGHFLAYLADGRTIVSGGLGAGCALIDSDAQRVTGVLESPAGDFRLTAISGDRTTLAACTTHDHVLIWHLESRALIARLGAPELAGVTCIALSSDGRRLFTGTREGDLLLWHVSDAVLQGRVHAHDGPVRFLACSPGSSGAGGVGEPVAAPGDLVATTGPDQLWRLWRPPELAPVALHPTPGIPGLLAFSPDGALIAGDAGEGELHLWKRRDSGWEPARTE